MNTLGHRPARAALAAATTLGILATALAITAIPAAAAGNFDPQLTISRSSDAARAASTFGLRIEQADNEEQIGAVRFALPRDFTLDTNVPGTMAQIGTLRVVLYTTPTRAQVTINGTLHDGNGSGRCGSAAQCVIAVVDLDSVVPGAGTVDVPLPITEDAVEYAIKGNLTEVWEDSQVQALQARLKELSVTLQATYGGEVIFANPTVAGPRQLSSSFTSANVPGYSTGGLHPDCGDPCAKPLAVKEYAPSGPALTSPANGVATLKTDVNFAWQPSWDANGDDVTYALVIDDDDPIDVGGALNSAQTLSPGPHTWRVEAKDAPPPASGAAPSMTPSGTWSLAILDASNSFVFTDRLRTDTLYVSPSVGAFLYREANGTEHGRVRSGLGDPSGVITHNEGFVLVVAYHGTVGTAAGTFSPGLQTPPRPFVGSSPGV